MSLLFTWVSLRHYFQVFSELAVVQQHNIVVHPRCSTTQFYILWSRLFLSRPSQQFYKKLLISSIENAIKKMHLHDN